MKRLIALIKIILAIKKETGISFMTLYRVRWNVSLFGEELRMLRTWEFADYIYCKMLLYRLIDREE